jgi:TPR repeat protein
LHLFTEAALLDNSQAAYNLGYMYTVGLGVGINNKEAISWYEKSASLGNEDALINLGFMYISATRCSKRYEKSCYVY